MSKADVDIRTESANDLGITNINLERQSMENHATKGVNEGPIIKVMVNSNSNDAMSTGQTLSKSNDLQMNLERTTSLPHKPIDSTQNQGPLKLNQGWPSLITKRATHIPFKSTTQTIFSLNTLTHQHKTIGWPLIVTLA